MRDIYDNMPDGEARREYNKRRLAELREDEAARQARIEMVYLLAMEPLTEHVL